jgi:hypothetical protein
MGSALAGLGRLWPALAGLGRLWPALAGSGRLWPALAGLGRLWPALAGLGRLWPALAGLGRLWQAWAGSGRLWPSLAGSGRLWPSLAGSGRLWPSRAGYGRPGLYFFAGTAQWWLFGTGSLTLHGPRICGWGPATAPPVDPASTKAPAWVETGPRHGPSWVGSRKRGYTVAQQSRGRNRRQGERASSAAARQEQAPRITSQLSSRFATHVTQHQQPAGESISEQALHFLGEYDLEDARHDGQ